MDGESRGRRRPQKLGAFRTRPFPDEDQIADRAYHLLRIEGKSSA
jgi:hypothetical protein